MRTRWPEPPPKLASLTRPESNIVSAENQNQKAGGTNQVQDFACEDEVVETVHDFLDGAAPVPPMHIKNIDIRRAQLLQACVDANTQALEAVANVICLDGDRVISALVA